MTGGSTVDHAVAPWSARTDRVVRWIGWHGLEIVVVGGTAVAGLVAHPLWWAVTVPAAAGWFAHERASRRRERATGGGAAVVSAGGDDASRPAGPLRVEVGDLDELSPSAGSDTSRAAGGTRQDDDDQAGGRAGESVSDRVSDSNDDEEVRRGLA